MLKLPSDLLIIISNHAAIGAYTGAFPTTPTSMFLTFWFAAHIYCRRNCCIIWSSLPCLSYSLLSASAWSFFSLSCFLYSIEIFSSSPKSQKDRTLYQLTSTNSYLSLAFFSSSCFSSNCLLSGDNTYFATLIFLKFRFSGWLSWHFVMEYMEI